MKLKNWVKRISVQSRALHLASKFSPAGAAILMYHSVRTDPERYFDSMGSGILHATSVFEQQMELLSKRFNPVGIDDICLFLKEGKKLPRRAVAVTFDDGYADNFHIAAPILSRLGIRATFYLTVGLIGKKSPPWFCRLRYAFTTTPRKQWLCPAKRQYWNLTSASDRSVALDTAFDLCAHLAGETLEQMIRMIEDDLEIEPFIPDEPFMMDWNQARALCHAGHVVGCHTLTHPNVAYLAENIARGELLQSKRKMEEELRVPVLHFSYPHPALDPHWTSMTVEISKNAGYRTAVTTRDGPVRSGDHPLALARIRTPRLETDFAFNLERTFLRRQLLASRQV